RSWKPPTYTKRAPSRGQGAGLPSLHRPHRSTPTFLPSPGPIDPRARKAPYSRRSTSPLLLTGDLISVPDMVTPWPLVGRDRELASFARAWAAQHCRGVVVYGQAGVGKTRLAEECLARATQAGVYGGRATASMAAATVPLGAIAHLIPAGLDLSDPV